MKLLLSRHWCRVRPWAVRIAWIATAIAPFVTHATIVTGRFRLIAACLAACQVIMVGTTVLRRGSGIMRVLGLAATGVMAVMVTARLAEPGRPGAPELLASSGLSHMMIYASLLAVFAHSLQPGQTPLVSIMARRLRGTLTPPIAVYTRSVTKAWCMFFAGQLFASAALFLLAPLAVWSLFVNVLDGPLVLLMFASEYAVRRVQLRNQTHMSPISMIRRLVAGGATLPEQP
jgi:uncharacterized membrane protein